jgi:hypothetical protein
MRLKILGGSRGINQTFKRPRGDTAQAILSNQFSKKAFDIGTLAAAQRRRHVKRFIGQHGQ